MTPTVRITWRGLGVMMFASAAVMLMVPVFAEDVPSSVLRSPARDPGVRPGPSGAGIFACYAIAYGLTDGLILR